MGTVDSHSDGLRPLFDVVPSSVVVPTAQFVAREGRQIGTSIDEKPCVGQIVFLSEAMQERRCRVGPAAAEHVDFEQ